MLITTDSLIIRNWSLDDIEEYADIVSDPEVMKYVAEGKVQNKLQAEEFVKNCIQYEGKKHYCYWAVEHKNDKKLIGWCGIQEQKWGLDFGWRLARFYWGQGLGTEAAKSVLNYLVNTLKIYNFICIAYKENKASIRIMEKIGLQFFENEILENKKEIVRYLLPG